MKTLFKTMAFVVLLSATACIKDGFIGENCPGDFSVSVVGPDGLGTDKNTTITVIMPDGSTKNIAIGNEGKGNIDLGEGKFQLVASTPYEKDKVNLEGDKITVRKDENGECVDPSDFNGGATDIEIIPGKEVNPNIEVPMVQQTRPLIVRVKLLGDAAQRVTGVNSKVDGIALSRHINHGFPPVDKKPRHPAIEATSIAYKQAKDENGFYSGTRKLLGIDGDAAQHLALTIHFDESKEVTYQYDISRDMDEFHITDVKEPWVIEIILQLGADFQATIVDWQVGPETILEAN